MPGAGLSARQAAILDELGIEVWARRDAVRDKQPAAAAPAPGNTPRKSLQKPADRPPGEPVASPPVAQPATPETPAAPEWQQLNAAIRSCSRCALHTTRTQAVCGVGHTSADWLVIGEAPGADEDRQGEPFVGRAGQLLNEMLRAIGLRREQVFIANILKCRPPNNADPRPEQIEQCLPYLRRQIELVQPRIILVVGRIAAQTLLDTGAAVGKLRGRRLEFDGIPLVVTYHPAYLLRSPAQKAKAWSDLLLASDVAAEAAT